MKPTCNWIYSKPGEQPVRRCHAVVGYQMVADDDERPMRRYNAFCAEHLKAAAQQDTEEEAGYGHGV